MIRRRSSSAGFSLIEMVLAISAVAIVLGLCAGLLHVLLRLDRTGRDHLVETATVGRLARQFRLDVHAAHAAKAGGGDDPAAKLELVLTDDRTVVYEARPHALTRVENQGAIVQRRETYSLPFCREAGFMVQAETAASWVRLRLRRSPANDKDNGPRGLRHDLQIDALAGKDQAHALPGPKHEETGP